MIDFSETIDYRSKVRLGVTFRLKRINAFTRISSDAQIADATAEYNEAVIEIAALESEARAKLPNSGMLASKDDPDVMIPVEIPLHAYTKEQRKELRKWTKLKDELYVGTIIPHTIRQGFVAAFGVEDEKGKPISELEEILRLSKNELIGELYGACRGASQMSPEDLGNSERPGTSSTPATPAAKSTTADTASESNSTKLEIADSSHKKSIAA